MRTASQSPLMKVVVLVVLLGYSTGSAVAQKQLAVPNPIAAQKQAAAAQKKPVAGPKNPRVSSLPETQLELVSVKKIWNKARHNGIPDLIRFKDIWYCCCREGDSHVGGTDGKIRIIASKDGETWESVAMLSEEGVDLRDPKLSETPDGRLMLVAGGSVFKDGDAELLITMQSRVAFSKNGTDWTPTQKVLEEKHWLWRVTWHEGRAYGISKVFEGKDVTRGYLYTSQDGVEWTLITELKIGVNYVSETTLRFTSDGEMIALIRPGYVGVSSPPYDEWSFRQVPAKISGPNLIRREDGSLWATTRGNGPITEAEKRTTTKTVASRTLLAQITTTGEFRTGMILPSAGDTGYAGLVLDGDTLWMAYYSSHEGQGIYLAKVRFPKE